MTNEVRHVTISINQSADKVYNFIADAKNFPRWAPGFCKSIHPTEQKNLWGVNTTAGKGTVRFVERNEFRVLDHYVNIESMPEVYMPMRVLENKEGCELVLSVFKFPGVNDHNFSADIEAVQKDLNSLKFLMESMTP